MISQHATFPQSTAELDGSAPLVRLNWIAAIGLFSLSACMMLNLNYFTRILFETEQVLSIFYLVACLTVLFSLKLPIFKSIGVVGFFWLFNILFFLTISTRFGLGVEREFFTSPSSNVYRILTAQLITVAAAVGTRHLVLAGKTQLLLRVVYGFSLLAASTIILSKFVPFLYEDSGQGRVGGVFSDANRAGHALCYSAAFGFACLQREKSLLFRALMFAGLAMLVPALLLTNSRSSILFMGLLVMIQLGTTSILKQKGTAVAILIIGAGIPVGIGVMLSQQGSHVNAREAKNLESQKDRLESFFRIMRGEISDQDTGHRFVVGMVGLRYFASSPIIGVGFHKLTRMPEVDLGCHNTYIRILGEGGLFCGIFYAAAIAAIGWVAWKSKMPEARCLGLGFTAMYACSAMVAHTLMTSRISNVSMGIVFGLLAAATTLQQRQEKMKRAEMNARQMHLQAASQQQQRPLIPQPPPLPSRS